MKRACLRGVVDGYSSYSLHLFRVAEGLAKHGRDVTIFPVSADTGKAPIPRVVQDALVRKHQLEDWEMVIHCPTFNAGNNKRVVYNTMWETTRLHKQCVLNLNQADLVIVPSTFNLTTFNAQGVQRTMAKVPMGIDTDIYRYCPPVKKDYYLFGAAGRTAAGGCRKGLQDVIDAWRKAFPKKVQDVRLHIKCYPDDPDLDFDDDRVLVSKEFWTRKQLAKWYEQIDCFASASKGEGWGLMQHEAMATGRAVIAVPFGGITEFYDESVGFPVEFKLEPSDNHYKNGGLWANPVKDSLVSRMREVYERRRSDKELKASERGMKLSWDHSNEILEKTLVKAGFYK